MVVFFLLRCHPQASPLAGFFIASPHLAQRAVIGASTTESTDAAHLLQAVELVMQMP